MNNAFTRQTGYTETDALGNNPRLFNSGRHPKEFWADFWTTILSGEVWRGEIVNRRKDGSMYDLDMTVLPVHDDNGKISCCIAILQDITERKHMEEALCRSESLYRAIGESIDYGVWVCEPDGRNTYASESFLKLVGITQKQCSDFGWGDLLHPDDAENTLTAWKECVRTCGNWDIEHRYRGVDGRYHHILARGVPVKDDTGKVLCWAGINLDISALKNAQQDLQERNKELARFNESIVGREMRMIELKKEVNELCAKAGIAPHYDLDWEKQGEITL